MNKKTNKRARTNRHPSFTTSSVVVTGNRINLHNNNNDNIAVNHPGQPMSSAPSFKIAKGGIKHQLNGYLAVNETTVVPLSATSHQMTPINNPLVPNPMSSSLDPLSIAKSAVGKGVTHQYQSVTNTQSTTNSTNGNNGGGASGGVGINTNLISGIPTDSSNKFTFLDPPQLGMGIESCLSELQTNFRNSLNEANAKNDDCNDPNNSNMNNDMNNNSNANNSFNTNNQNHNQLSMTRDSSLVDLAIIPSLSSTQFTNYSLNNNTTINDKSLESEYGMTFIDFPTGGIDPASLPPPED